MIKKNNCTNLVDGIVISVKSKGLDWPSVITVEYEINNIKYQIKESIKLKSTIIKLGFLPIGQKKIPKINSTVGAVLQVKYNPNEPSEAYIVGNEGIINC